MFILIFVFLAIIGCENSKSTFLPNTEEYILSLEKQVEKDKEYKELLSSEISKRYLIDNFQIIYNNSTEKGVFTSFSFEDRNSDLYFGMAYGIQTPAIKIEDIKIQKYEKTTSLLSSFILQGNLIANPPQKYEIYTGIVDDNRISKIKLTFNDYSASIIQLKENQKAITTVRFGDHDTIKKIELLDTSEKIIEAIDANSVNSIEVAVKQKQDNLLEIIHQFDVKNGKIVFYTTDISKTSKSSIHVAYIKQTAFGWKVQEKGGYSSINDQKMYSAFLENLSIVYGEINDPNIVKILIEFSDNEKKSTEIVTSGDMKIWYFAPIHIDRKIKINGLNSEGEVLYSEFLEPGQYGGQIGSVNN